MNRDTPAAVFICGPQPNPVGQPIVVRLIGPVVSITTLTGLESAACPGDRVTGIDLLPTDKLTCVAEFLLAEVVVAEDETVLILRLPVALLEEVLDAVDPVVVDFGVVDPLTVVVDDELDDVVLPLHPE